MGRFPALHRVRKKGGSVCTASGSGSGSALNNYGNGQKALTSKVHLIDVPVGQFSNERESQNRHSSKGIINLADSLPAARSEIMCADTSINIGIEATIMSEHKHVT